MRAFLVIALMGVVAGRAWASSYSPAEGSMVSSMARCIDSYEKKYGVLPTQISELDEFILRPFDEYFHYASPSKRYVFVASFQMPPPVEGTIIAMARKPGYETTLSDSLSEGLKGPGRYLIFRNPEGHIVRRWVSEYDVKQIFKEAKQPLPVPDNEPEPRHIAKVRKGIYVRWAIYALVILAAVAGYLWIKQRKARAG